MPRRRLSALPDSRTRNQELRSVMAGRGFGRQAVAATARKGALYLAAKAGAYLAENKGRIRDVARMLNKYTPKKYAKSSFARKLGTKSTQTEAKVGPGEGQSITIRSGYKHINIGGSNQITKIPKIVEPLWSKHMFNYVSAQRAIATTILGSNILATVDSGALPIICYDLTFNGALNKNSDAFFAGRLWEDGRWTDLAQTPVWKDTNTGTGTTAPIERCSVWLHEKLKIRLLLYGRQKQSTAYKIIFFRVKDEQSCPNRTDASFDRDEINKNLWFPIVSKYTTNPVNIGHDPTMFREGRKAGHGIQVLKTFTYNIDEQLSTEETVRKVNVNFMVHLNKLKTHNESNTDSVYQSDITAIAPSAGTTVNNENATKTALPSQRVYMAIIASCYETVSDAGFESPSYDINLQQHMRASLVHGWPV